MAGWRILNRPDDVYSYLVSLSATIHETFSYSRREARGTQSALTTVERRSGTCRDFALLFMECARLSGFAARFVTGYLHVRDDDERAFLVAARPMRGRIFMCRAKAGWSLIRPT